MSAIVEGEWDLQNRIFLIILVILLVSAMIVLTPFLIECLYRLENWWDSYYWIPCLPCGVVS